MARLAPQLRWCSVEEIVFILDIDKGEYFALDAVTSANFIGCVDGSADIDPAHLDVFRSRQWIVGEDAPHARPLPSTAPPATLASRTVLAFFCILSARRRLSRDGFGPTYRWAEAVGTGVPAPADRLESDLRRFVRAETVLLSKLGERDCLPRSLALFTYLRSLGHRARHVIGVARFPFDAHAWVEHAGQPLLEYRAEQALLPRARTPKGRTPIAIIDPDG